MENKNNKEKDLNKKLDSYLSDKNQQEECVGDECLIKTDKSIVERMNKKIVTSDGRQLLT